MGMSSVMRAAKLLDRPDLVVLKGTTLKLRDDQVAIDLYTSSAKTVSTIDGPTDDGAIVVIRGYAGTSDVTFDENGNILTSSTSSVVGPNDTLILRYDAASAKWHELQHVTH